MPWCTRQVIMDLSYAPAEPPDGRGHLLDLYLPDGPDGDRRPLLIWTGGSGWMADNGKDSAGPIAAFFNPLGYAVAGVSIRASSQATFPAQLHDIKAAIRWLRAHAGEYRLDADRFAVMGDSSGGWTAAMAALTGHDDAPSAVRAAVAFFPPVDFLQMDAQMPPGAREFFNASLGLTDCHDDPGSPESALVGFPIRSRPQDVRATNPATYVSRSSPPIMLLHGQDDRLVPHGQSILLYNALRAAGAEATFFSVPGAGHDLREILDPANHSAHTVHRTGRDGERITVGAPAPGWDVIEHFLREALA
jgi:acetyl esterase/lipase